MSCQVSRGLSVYSINHSLSCNQLNHGSDAMKEFQNRFLKIYIKGIKLLLFRDQAQPFQPPTHHHVVIYIVLRSNFTIHQHTKAGQSHESDLTY
jgi:hypothetical protein